MKLEGFKVIDLSVFLPGPQMTAMMADHGAQVIKIESPAGDPARAIGPFEEGQSVWFRTLNRGKQAQVLDLKALPDRQRLHELVADADVFVESFRPGVVKRLGADYETLSALNPGLIYCSISAFGQTGPLAQHPAHDMAVAAFAGFMSVNNNGNDKPVVPSLPAADMGASLTALSAVLMALLGRHRTGRGDYLDIAMYDSLMPWCSHYIGPTFVDGEPINAGQQRSLGGAAFYHVYTTGDNRYVVLGGREEKFVRTLLGALNREDLIDSCLADAGAPQQAAIDFLTATFRSKTRDQWTAWFAELDVCFAPVLNFVEAFAHEQVVARDMLLIGPAGEHVIGSPIKFRNEPAEITFSAPPLDTQSTQ